MPLATTLALVVLAAWGVVLVTRGRFRRAVAVLGAVASVGVLATVVSGWWLVPQTLRDSAADRAWTRSSSARPGGSGWPWSGRVAQRGRHGAGGLPGARAGPRWAPATTPRTGDGTSASAAEPSHLDLWKSLDHGQDPTV